MLRFALCQGAGLRICASCERLADHHPEHARHPHQPWVAPVSTDRCPRWQARLPKHAVTPTDDR